MPTLPPNASLFAPVFALVAWTFCILLLIAFRRLQAGFNGTISPREYALGESGRVTATVSLPNRNYMNLLELPLLFYVAMLLAHVTSSATPLLIYLAWAYVALRVVHSLIHITYNDVLHRFAAFAASNTVLVVMWTLLARAVLFA
jgi:hypothetical protein